MFAAIFGSLLSLASILNVVPRIRLVEAVGLFATAFGAGAGLADALSRARRASGSALRR